MLIYKICTRALWEETQRSGEFPGMPVDMADGYIHFSTEQQQAETAQKYFAGQRDLVLLSVDSAALGAALRWEPSSSGSRAGDFLHLYGPLPLCAILSATSFDVPQ
ncbi:MAG: DUF952 domain-containing protein [Pseudomonadota bacterium]